MKKPGKASVLLIFVLNVEVILGVRIVPSYHGSDTALKPKVNVQSSMDISASIAKSTPEAVNLNKKLTANQIASDISGGIARWAREAAVSNEKLTANRIASDISGGVAKWAREAAVSNEKLTANRIDSHISAGVAESAHDVVNDVKNRDTVQVVPVPSSAHFSVLHNDAVEAKDEITTAERSTTLGMYHGFDDFNPNTTITMGGYWSNVNMTGSLDCLLQNVSICQVKSAVNEHRQCFQYHDQSKIFHFGSELLNTSDVKLVRPDRKMHELPFPTPFNATVVRIVPLSGCQNNPITCHPMISDGCLVYVCHVLHNTKAFQVTIKTDKIDDYVNMMAICHYETKEFIPTHLAFRLLHKQPGDVVCHFVGVANYLMCTNDKE